MPNTSPPNTPEQSARVEVDAENVKLWVLKTHGYWSDGLTFEENIVNALRCLQMNDMGRRDYSISRMWQGRYETERARLPKMRAVYEAGKVRRKKLREELDRAKSALEAAERRGAEVERAATVNILTEYMLTCEGTGCKLAEAEDETSVNMYWRADGAADALEHLIGILRSRSTTETLMVGPPEAFDEGEEEG